MQKFALMDPTGSLLHVHHPHFPLFTWASFTFQRALSDRVGTNDFHETGSPHSQDFRNP